MVTGFQCIIFALQQEKCVGLLCLLHTISCLFILGQNVDLYCKILVYIPLVGCETWFCCLISGFYCVVLFGFLLLEGKGLVCFGVLLLWVVCSWCCSEGILCVCASLVSLLWMMLAILHLSFAMKVGISNQEAASICWKSFPKHLILHTIESGLVWGFFTVSHKNLLRQLHKKCETELNPAGETK